MVPPVAVSGDSRHPHLHAHWLCLVVIEQHHRSSFQPLRAFELSGVSSDSPDLPPVAAKIQNKWNGRDPSGHYEVRISPRKKNTSRI